VGYHYDGSEVAPRGWLTGAVWHWDDLFEDIMQTIVDGEFAGSRYNGDFRGSLTTGDNPLTLTEPGPSVSPDTAALMADARGHFGVGDSPFAGPVVDRDGVERVAPGRKPTLAQIDAMDWFVAGVEGDIPTG